MHLKVDTLTSSARDYCLQMVIASHTDMYTGALLTEHNQLSSSTSNIMH
jgi:hypothetical protein